METYGGIRAIHLEQMDTQGIVECLDIAECQDTLDQEFQDIQDLEFLDIVDIAD